jgi:hypothetical protein
LQEDVTAARTQARRKPISRVLSVTDTSMTFMTPIPPTSNETLATAPSNSVQGAR